MKKIAMMVVFPMSITGCTLFDGPGSQIGWRDAKPPVTDGVGRIVKNNNLSQLAFPVSPEMLEELESYMSVSTEQNAKYKAATEVAFKQITANAKLEFISGKSMKSDQWRIVQLKDFSTAVVDTEFAYSCLTANSYKYTVSRKTTAGVELDASELAKKLGGTAAKVEVGMVPDDPSKAEISVQNPRICLSFLSATFERDRSFTKNDGPRHFKVGDSSKFTLTSSNGVIASAEPDFGRRAIHTKPTYKLYAVQEGGQQHLQIKVFDSAMYKKGYTVPIPELVPGTWDSRISLPTFGVGDNVYGFMYVDIKAKRTPENEILVSKAALFSPEYKLKTK
ncbi:hypothetical protein PPUN110474_27670 [Pseudomonas putida]|nr:hypothetical protein PPUN110474_27670 [Pseudomonas putida]